MSLRSGSPCTKTSRPSSSRTRRECSISCFNRVCYSSREGRLFSIPRDTFARRPSAEMIRSWLWEAREAAVSLPADTAARHFSINRCQSFLDLRVSDLSRRATSSHCPLIVSVFLDHGRAGSDLLRSEQSRIVFAGQKRAIVGRHRPILFAV